MFVSEGGGVLYIHELSLSPKESCRRIMQLPSPEPDLGNRRGMLKRGAQAVWAPDDSAVALVYSIKHDKDPRTDSTGSVQVLLQWMGLHTAACNCVNWRAHCQIAGTMLRAINPTHPLGAGCVSAGCGHPGLELPH